MISARAAAQAVGPTLADVLTDAAHERFPPPDGGVTVLPQPSHRDAGIIAFTGHSVVFADVNAEWITDTLASLECDPLAATLHPRFLTALMDHTDRTADTIDLLAAARPLPGPPPLALREIQDTHHPRVARARRYRDDLRVWTTDGAVLILGRAVAGRWETAIEVDQTVRHRGLGRLLASAARHLVPAGQPVWAQLAPGNARSLRAFQSAGYRAVGAEILLLPREDELRAERRSASPG